MSEEPLFTCLRGKKEKKYPDDPKRNHTVFYDCVSGKNYWPKAKLFTETHEIHFITIEKFHLKEFEVSKHEAQDERPV